MGSDPFISDPIYLGAGIEVVWKEFSATALLGVIFFSAALMRFRKTISGFQM